MAETVTETETETETEIAEDGAVETIPDSTFNGVRSSVRRLARVIDDPLYRGARRDDGQTMYALPPLCPGR